MIICTSIKDQERGQYHLKNIVNVKSNSEELFIPVIYLRNYFARYNFVVYVVSINKQLLLNTKIYGGGA